MVSLGLATYQHVRPPSWPHLSIMRRVYSLRVDELEPPKLVVRVDSPRPLQFSEIILSLDFQSVREKAEASPEFSVREDLIRPPYRR